MGPSGPTTSAPVLPPSEREAAGGGGAVAEGEKDETTEGVWFWTYIVLGLCANY